MPRYFHEKEPETRSTTNQTVELLELLTVVTSFGNIAVFVRPALFHRLVAARLACYSTSTHTEAYRDVLLGVFKKEDEHINGKSLSAEL